MRTELATNRHIRNETTADRLADALGAYVREPSTHHAREVAAALDDCGNTSLLADTCLELMRTPGLWPEDIADATRKAVFRGVRKCGHIIRAVNRAAGAA